MYQTQLTTQMSAMLATMLLMLVRSRADSTCTPKNQKVVSTAMDIHLGQRNSVDPITLCGNALFQLTVTHSLQTNSFGNEIAGAPMCLYAKDAPAIDQAACSEILFDQSCFQMELLE